MSRIPLMSRTEPATHDGPEDQCFENQLTLGSGCVWSSRSGNCLPHSDTVSRARLYVSSTRPRGDSRRSCLSLVWPCCRVSHDFYPLLGSQLPANGVTRIRTPAQAIRRNQYAPRNVAGIRSLLSNSQTERRGDNWIRHYVRNGRCPSGNHIDSNQLPLSDFRLCTQYGFLDIIPKFLFRWTRNIQCHSNCASHGRTVHCRKGTFKSRAQFGSQNLVHQDEAVKGRTNSEDPVNSPYRLASTWLSFLRSSTS